MEVTAWSSLMPKYLDKVEKMAKKLSKDKLLVLQGFCGDNVKVEKSTLCSVEEDIICFVNTRERTLQNVLEFLQYFSLLDYDEPTLFKIPVLGKQISFQIHEGPEWTIFFNDATSKWFVIEYSCIVQRLRDLLKINQRKLADIILKNLKSPLGTDIPRNLPKAIVDVIEDAVWFVLGTHIRHATVPQELFRKLQDKSNVIPMYDRITRAKLRKIRAGISTFGAQFYDESINSVHQGFPNVLSQEQFSDEDGDLIHGFVV